MPYTKKYKKQVVVEKIAVTELEVWTHLPWLIHNITILWEWKGIIKLIYYWYISLPRKILVFTYKHSKCEKLKPQKGRGGWKFSKVLLLSPKKSFSFRNLRRKKRSSRSLHRYSPAPKSSRDIERDVPGDIPGILPGEIPGDIPRYITV